MKSYWEEKFIGLLKQPIKTTEEVVEMENARVEFEKELQIEQVQLIQELRKKDIIISNIWDLVNTKGNYKNGFNILIDHLSKPYHNKTKEGIVRALAVKEVPQIVNSILLEEYHKTPKDNKTLRWAIGNTIYNTITENYKDKIIDIVKDKTNGISRHMFILALGKIKCTEVENVLIDLLNDEEVCVYALETLAKLKSKNAKEKISYLINNSTNQIKREALKALKKID